MKQYKVIWEIQVDAPSAEEAAEIAREFQLDPDSHATVFKVQRPDGLEVIVDLMERPGQ